MGIIPLLLRCGDAAQPARAIVHQAKDIVALFCNPQFITVFSMLSCRSDHNLNRFQDLPNLVFVERPNALNKTFL